MKIAGLVICVLSLSLAGCGTKVRLTESARPKPAPVLAPALESLADSRWTLIELGGEPVQANSNGWPALSLEFDAVGRGVTGHGGVNRFAGRYSSVGDKLEFGPLAMTRRAGPPAQMELEQRYTQALSRVVRWRQAGSNLVLIGPGDVRLALLAPVKE